MKYNEKWREHMLSCTNWDDHLLNSELNGVVLTRYVPKVPNILSVPQCLPDGSCPIVGRCIFSVVSTQCANGSRRFVGSPLLARWVVPHFCRLVIRNFVPDPSHVYCAPNCDLATGEKRSLPLFLLRPKHAHEQKGVHA